jgi:hypothetical protein
MVPSVLGITACRLPSNQATATVLEATRHRGAAAPAVLQRQSTDIRLNQYRRSGDRIPGRRPAESRQKRSPSTLAGDEIDALPLVTDGLTSSQRDPKDEMLSV